MSEVARIAVLSPDLADQIAAGEVVERPASVVKELVENAIDAGARRVEVELTRGGLERIRVVDDGGGIHHDDLVLAVTRHATSKVRTPEDLREICTLGFRGEALASVTAVASYSLRSRSPQQEMGHELRGLPGQPPVRTPMGMPVGTQIQVDGLFATIPARRKFLRSEATEAAQCSEAVLRTGLVHPAVHLTLTNGGRELVHLAAASQAERVGQILARRGGGELFEVSGEHQGVAVRAWIGDPARAIRGRNGVFVVVRRRVVKERAVAQIVGQVLAGALPPGLHPLACVMVEPPPGAVDVNVHPQKSEVRFSRPQEVFAAVRDILGRGLASASWARVPAAPVGVTREAVEAPGSMAYRLGTRALDGDYADYKEQARGQVDRLRAEAFGERAEDGPAEDGPAEDGPAEDGPAEDGSKSSSGPEFLACLPGPVGLFCRDGALLAVDLVRLRSHLVYARLQRALGGSGVAAQGLLNPVVVSCPASDVDLIAARPEPLARLGLRCEPFGEDAVVVRAIPAALSGCVEEADVRDLINRVLPWLRLHDRDAAGMAEGAGIVASTRGADPAPRLARRWLREALESGADLDSIPGVRRWSSEELLAGDDA